MNNNVYSMGFNDGYNKVTKMIIDLKGKIEEIDIELFFTKIKDNEGKTIPESEEIMGLFQIFWEQMRPKILSIFDDALKEKDITKLPNYDKRISSAKNFRKAIERAGLVGMRFDDAEKEKENE